MSMTNLKPISHCEKAFNFFENGIGTVFQHYFLAILTMNLNPPDCVLI